MKDRLKTPLIVKRVCNWQTLMAAFAAVEILLFSTRVYTPLIYINYLRQIGEPLVVAFAAIALVQSRDRWRSGVWIVALYFFWYIGVLVLNGRFFSEDFPQYERTVYRLLFTTLVCFPLGGLLVNDGRERSFRPVLCVISAWFACVSVAGIYCTITQTLWKSPLLGTMLGISEEEGFRLTVFTHPNIFAALAVLSLLLAVYLLVDAKHLAEKVWHLVCAVSLYVALALTGSRTSMIAVAVATGFLPFLWIREKLIDVSVVRRWLGSLLGAGIAVVLCFAGFQPVTQGINALAKGLQPKPAAADTKNVSAPQPETAAADADAVPTPQPIVSQRSLSSAEASLDWRFDTWAAAMRALADRPAVLIRGTTQERVAHLVHAYAQPGDVLLYNMHNSYLEVLMSMGLPGFALMLALLVLVAKASWRLMFSVRPSAKLSERFLPAVLVAALIIGTMETFYFQGQFVTDRILFLVAGYVVALACKRSAKAEAGGPA